MNKKRMITSLIISAVLLFAAGCENQSDTISLVSREDGSGTRSAFIELFEIEEQNSSGEKEDMTSLEAQITNSTSVVMTTVAGDKSAIGYISLGSLNDTVKAIKIDGVGANANTIKDGSYKIQRKFHIVTKGGLTPAALDFMNYILSLDGQKIVESEGYVPMDGAQSYQGTNPSQKVVVGGSSSVTPVMEKLAEAYKKVNANANIEIQQSDSTTGIKIASDGLCDIGMSSRELKDSEKDLGLADTVIATDGIVVIVNKDNPTEDLRLEQVQSIYMDKITDWSKVSQ